MATNPFAHTEYSISDSLKTVRKSVLIYENIIFIITNHKKTLDAKKIVENKNFLYYNTDKGGHYRKANGSPQLIVISRSNLTLVGAVAFLMFIFIVRLYDTDDGHNNADDCDYNTDNANYNAEHLSFLSCVYHRNHLPNIGSPHNVPIVAKGEPLTVLVVPISFYIFS